MAIFRLFKMAAVAIMYFRKFQIFNGQSGQEGRTASSCQISSKSLEPRPRYYDFLFFQDGGRPPSWICDACVGTTHEGHLVVFITVQNLVEIDAVVLIICTFFDFASLAWKRLFMPQNCFFFGGFWPSKCGVMWTDPKRHILARVHFVWAIMRENPSMGLTGRWVPKKGV